MPGHRHTAAQRAATRLDVGARSLILGVVLETAGVKHQQVIVALFRDRYGTVDDYYAAVDEVHGRRRLSASAGSR